MTDDELDVPTIWDEIFPDPAHERLHLFAVAIHQWLERLTGPVGVHEVHGELGIPLGDALVCLHELEKHELAKKVKGGYVWGPAEEEE